MDPLKLTCSQQLWLHSSVGRALQRYRRGHGFESRWSLNFFQASLSQLLKLRINREDLSWRHLKVNCTCNYYSCWGNLLIRLPLQYGARGTFGVHCFWNRVHVTPGTIRTKTFQWYLKFQFLKTFTKLHAARTFCYGRLSHVFFKNYP